MFLWLCNLTLTQCVDKSESCINSSLCVRKKYSSYDGSMTNDLWIFSCYDHVQHISIKGLYKCLTYMYVPMRPMGRLTITIVDNDIRLQLKPPSYVCNFYYKQTRSCSAQDIFILLVSM